MLFGIIYIINCLLGKNGVERRSSLRIDGVHPILYIVTVIRNILLIVYYTVSEYLYTT